MIRRYRRLCLTWIALAALTASLTTGAGAQEALLDEPAVTAAVQVTGNADAARAHSTPQIARNPVTGELVIAEAEVRTKKTCDIHISVDDGRSWFDGGNPMTKPFTDCTLQATNGPYITLQFTPGGTLFASFFANDPKYVGQLNRSEIPRHIFVARSDDSGRTWSTSMAHEGKEGDPGVGGSRRAQLSVDTNNPQHVYVGWQKGGFTTPAPGAARKGMISVSHDRGRSFGPPLELSDARGGGQPRTAVDSKGVVHAVFAADTFGTPTGDAAPPRPIVYRRSIDQGRTWSAGQEIDPGNVGFSFNRRQLIAVDPVSDALFITWAGNPNPRARRPPTNEPSTPAFDDREIMFRSSTDGGNTWSPSKMVNDDAPTPNVQHYNPGISVAPNGRVDLAWYDFRNSPTPEFEGPGGNAGGMNDIYAASSFDRGGSFTKNVRVSDRIIDRNIGVWSNNAHSQTSVAVTSSDTTTYVAWQDSRNGNAVTNVEDIYFAAVQHARPVAAGAGDDEDDVPGWVVVASAAAVGMGVTVLLALFLSRRRSAAA
ncbi:MAG TPA: sialidase family protein [Acidimicrobiales bacterium]|nr:sialidase family protein [Acidimicrobiales bacterium]